MALFDRYSASGAANPKTIRKWRSRVAALVEHLGHDDASRVTRADLNGWTAALIAKGLAKKTVVDGYLPPVRVAFAVAHDDGAISANPAAGLTVRAPKAVKLRDRDLTDSEAEMILRAALAPQNEKLAEPHARARRWVPWLCAYTGARVGEITQLRAMDIRQEGGIWVVHITPEAGPVKTNEARSIPLHPHLIEQGITSLARAGDTTPLFYRGGAGNGVNPGQKIRAADLAKWVRSLGVTAPQPNHGWRHRFKTVARSVGMAEDVADRIQGHTPRHEGGKYGSIPLPVLSAAIETLPRYEVHSGQTGRRAEAA
jgi:integrase